jgi:putative lipoic acid-binding regulatory protein
MTAPLNITNRFELTLTKSPLSLSSVLDQFAESNISPTAVNAVSHGADLLAVTVTVQEIGEDRAETLHSRLKKVPAVTSARLEHMVS